MRSGCGGGGGNGITSLQISCLVAFGALAIHNWLQIQKESGRAKPRDW